jgi:hypothetical protein
MNCYYSHLIEGHDTHPVDIERALQNDYSNRPRGSAARSQGAINVQKWIDEGGLRDRRAFGSEGVQAQWALLPP